MKKRCVFCHKVLDEKGYCQNKACPDYIRTQILEKDDNQNVKCVRYKPESTTTEDKPESTTTTTEDKKESGC